MRACLMGVLATALMLSVGCGGGGQESPAPDPETARSDTTAEATSEMETTMREETTEIADGGNQEPTNPCPPGEGMSPDGLCVPMAVVESYRAQQPPFQYSDPETACLQKQMNEAVADRGQAYLDELIDEGLEDQAQGTDTQLTDLLAREGYVC